MYSEVYIFATAETITSSTQWHLRTRIINGGSSMIKILGDGWWSSLGFSFTSEEVASKTRFGSIVWSRGQTGSVKLQMASDHLNLMLRRIKMSRHCLPTWSTGAGPMPRTVKEPTSTCKVIKYLCFVLNISMCSTVKILVHPQWVTHLCSTSIPDNAGDQASLFGKTSKVEELVLTSYTETHLDERRQTTWVNTMY